MRAKNFYGVVWLQVIRKSGIKKLFIYKKEGRCPITEPCGIPPVTVTRLDEPSIFDTSTCISLWVRKTLIQSNRHPYTSIKWPLNCYLLETQFQGFRRVQRSQVNHVWLSTVSVTISWSITELHSIQLKYTSTYAGHSMISNEIHQPTSAAVTCRLA